ncbi:MAG TPA: protein kinase [Pyrinomonadaceae bacterium]|nr:protein kinase [Pyrinomonadaceae bacterium]
MIQAGTKLGRYEIRSKLGVGGMGEVFLAHDAMLDRKVALKILPSELASNQNRMRRFTQEAKAAAALNHPNIAHIYEIGEHEGMHFIAMEYVDGSTLREAIHRERIGIPKLLRYLQQVAEGLTKAHAAGIVHRDLKPDNVMITRDGHPKILDFGLAKLTEPLTPEPMTSHAEATTELLSRPLSTPGLVMGTVGYMSPEQAQSHPVDHRSDIFAFGCLLYEAATGQRAFQSESTIDTLHKIVHTPARLVRDLNPSAPADLTRIVRRCLAKDPDDRYQSIREAAIELRDVRRELEGAIEMETTVPSPSGGTTRSSATADSVAGTPVSTSPSSAEYLFSGIKRHKLVTAGVLAGLVLVGAALAAYWHARGTEVAIESIAVLPFVNQNQDPDTEYLSDGLTESITNSLSQLSNLRVIPSPSIARYKTKEIDAITAGNELGVRAILTGRILQRGDSLTVNAALIDVRDNKQLWGEQYNRKVADALAVQQEISREISERLRTRLSGEEQKQMKKRDTSNPEAYQAYIRGRYYWNKRTAENVKKAIEQFQQAADKDPNYALAYVGLADCYVLLIEYAGASTTDTVPKSIALAERALQLDPSLGEAHTSLGWCYGAGLWQWGKAESEFKRAIELSPNYPTAHQWYSLVLRDQGRFDEAKFEIKRAQELDPLSLIIGQSVAQSYLFLEGDSTRALEEAKRVVDLDPNYPRGLEVLGWIYLKQGRNSEAIAALQKAVAAGGDRRIFSSLGYVLAISGKKAEALKLLKEVRAKYERHEALGKDVAGIYAGLGDKDQVFIWLEKDFQARVGPLSRIRWEPPFESVRNDPRFADLLRRMGLEP